MTDITAAHPDSVSSAPDGELDPRVARSRAKVLTAATELLVEGGPRAVTVDAVSERSGVAKSTLYRHWPSRTDLLVDVLRSNIPHLPPVDTAAGFEAALRQHFDDVARTFADPRWSAILPALLMLKNQFAEVDEITQIDREQKHELLADILDLGVAEGRIPAGLDAGTVGATLFGPMMFAVLVGAENLAEIGRFAIDRFLDSYRPGRPTG